LFLKKFGSSSNSLRHQLKISSVTLSNKKYQLLNSGYAKSAGRTRNGKIVIRGRLGHKSKYTHVDFFRRSSTKLALVIDNIKNSNRNTLMSLIKYSSGGYSYILSTLGFINGF
jgi:ribosomal protein L2